MSLQRLVRSDAVPSNARCLICHDLFSVLSQSTTSIVPYLFHAVRFDQIHQSQSWCRHLLQLSLREWESWALRFCHRLCLLFSGPEFDFSLFSWAIWHMTNRRLELCWVCAHEFHKIESQTSSSLLSCEGDYEENRQDVRPDAGRGPALNPNRPEDRYWLQESLVLALFALWHLLLFFAFALTTRIPALNPSGFLCLLTMPVPCRWHWFASTSWFISHCSLVLIPCWIHCASARNRKMVAAVAVPAEQEGWWATCPFLNAKIAWDIATEVCRFSSQPLFPSSFHCCSCVQVYSYDPVPKPFLILRFVTRGLRLPWNMG